MKSLVNSMKIAHASFEHIHQEVTSITCKIEILVSNFIENILFECSEFTLNHGIIKPHERYGSRHVGSICEAFS